MSRFAKSSWTPLNNEEANRKLSDMGPKSNMPSHKPSFQPNMMFDERRVLVGKWFDKWNDTQRRQVIEDLLAKCKVRQIEFMGDLVNQRRPVHHDDFTRHLPRVLSLYVFSYLDPRSLSRCARVCWHWKHLTEVDQLWLPKCVRIGWMLTFSPSPYEVGIWKRFYIENVTQLKAVRPRDPVAHKVDKLVLQTNGFDVSRPNTGRRRTPRPQSAGRPNTPGRPPTASRPSTPGTPGTPKRPPWRGSDSTPQDIWRNNILDNDDEVEKVNKLRKKGMLVGNETSEMLKRVKTKLNTGQKNQSSISRSRSISGLQQATTPGDRPEWAKTSPTSTLDTKPHVNGTSSPEKDEVSRPKPVKAMPTKKAQHRTPRDPPTSELFPDRPWQIPDNEEYDSD